MPRRDGHEAVIRVLREVAGHRARLPAELRQKIERILGLTPCPCKECRGADNGGSARRSRGGGA